jgi:hypothetical protein
MSDLDQVRFQLIDFSHFRINIIQLKQTLELFLNHVKSLKERDRYIDANLKKLSAIKFELEYVCKQPEHITEKNNLILYRDKLFGSILRKVQVEKDNQRVTKLFNEFIKAITFFENESIDQNITNQPRYHRKTSSPPRGSQNPTCGSSNSPNSRQEKQSTIRKCFIERMIYDNIWAHIMGCAQDKWLVETETAYKTCFPNSKLRVELEYNDNMIPIKMKMFDNEDIEEYEKRYDDSLLEYLEDVYCLRYDSDGTVKRKLTSFNSNSNWETLKVL